MIIFIYDLFNLKQAWFIQFQTDAPFIEIIKHIKKILLVNYKI